MAKIAKAEPGTTIRYPHGGTSHVFQFGEDGTRQVTEAEAEALRSYTANGGPVKVEIAEQKAKSGGKSDG